MAHLNKDATAAASFQPPMLPHSKQALSLKSAFKKNEIESSVPIVKYRETAPGKPTQAQPRCVVCSIGGYRYPLGSDFQPL